MKVLVACEYSGIVRDAFIKKGHKVLSCDLLPTEKLGPHYQGDVLRLLENVGSYYFDLMIAHPPCTYLCSSGARWWKDKKEEQNEALDFVWDLMCADVHKICIENPVGKISTIIEAPAQYIQPWQFGHGETKKTGLWLKGLPVLKPTKNVPGRENKIHLMPPSKNRSKQRSLTYTGIARAMAEQWNY